MLPNATCIWYKNKQQFTDQKKIRGEASRINIYIYIYIATPMWHTAISTEWMTYERETWERGRGPCVATGDRQGGPTNFEL